MKDQIAELTKAINSLVTTIKNTAVYGEPCSHEWQWDKSVMTWVCRKCHECNDIITIERGAPG
jgi:hypothetical protein